MATAAFESGALVTIDNKSFTLVRKVDGDVWQLEECRTKRVHEYHDRALRALYTAGVLRFGAAKQAGVRSEHESDVATLSIPDSDWEIAKTRRAYVMAVSELPHTAPRLRPVIEDIWARLKAPASPPDPVTVIRWCKRFLGAGRDIRALIDRHRAKGNRTRRYPPEVLEAVEAAVDHTYLTKEGKSIEDTLNAAIVAIYRENGLRPSPMQLPVPTRRLVTSAVQAIPAFERCIARYGRDTAMKMFRGVLAHSVVVAPLDRAEIDHTPLDLLVIDEKSGLPLGRPYLTVCLDSATRCVLGLHISFEPPSYLTVARCLRDAFLPKVDLRQQYPRIRHDWEPHGVMIELVVDNGAEFHSRSLENACLTLGIEIHYSPRKRPWFKGKVERLLRTMNAAIAHGVPGSTFSNIFERSDYDPAKHAVVRLSTLQEIARMWVVDVYHERPHRALKERPIDMWRTGIAPEDIRLPDDPDSLSAILGRSDTRVLTHKGVEFDGLFYNSPEMIALRRREGDRLNVDIRIDDGDIGWIYVIAPDKRQHFKVAALARDYAQGLTRWQHHVIKRFAAQNHRPSEPESWREAKAAIEEIIAQDLQLKRRTTHAKIGRYQTCPSPCTVPETVASDASAKTHSRTDEANLTTPAATPPPEAVAQTPNATLPPRHLNPITIERLPADLIGELGRG